MRTPGVPRKRRAAAPMGRRAARGVLLLAYAAALLSRAGPLRAAAAADAEDLYARLGVGRRASVQEIKTAYRRKARDTHPDKNRGVPPEEAAERFRRVVHAFEVLSDDASRRHYDRTGRADGGGGGGDGDGGGGWNNWNNWQWSSQQRQRGGGGGSFHMYWNFRPMKLKDRFQVQEAMSRALHVASLEQLKTIMLDENDRLERNILVCAYTPPLEQHVDEEMVFPYPFAAMSSQGIWWEDLLQTIKIRYRRANELSKFFSLPDGDELSASGAPIFLYAKKGDPLDRVTRFQTADRAAFEAWAWEQMQVRVLFVNKHDHPVELFWIHGSRANSKEFLEPGHEVELTSMLTHEWYIRDKRVDSRPDSPGSWKLTKESSLMTLKIGVEGGPKIRDDWTTTVVIPRRTCFDLSGHCTFWAATHECEKNPVFMSEVCLLSCKLCESDEPTSFDEDEATAQPPDEPSEEIPSGDNEEPANNDEL